MNTCIARIPVILVAFLCICGSTANAQGDPTFGYKLELDVVYGQGRIAPEGKEQMRDLKMDVYTPTNPDAGPWPAVVYVHGGAWHRGGRRNPPYKLAGAVHSSPEDWARLLAVNGYKVFVIEYRLAPQNPIPRFVQGKDNTVPDIGKILSEQELLGLSRGRAGIGLPPLEYNKAGLAVVWNAYMSGVEDAEVAVRYIVENASDFNIDPERIGMGGHSAGGGLTYSVGLGLKTPLKAIFPMSGPMPFFEPDYIMGRSDLPAVLTHYAQYDDGPLLPIAESMAAMLNKADTEFTLAWVPGFMHFYPYNAPTLADDGTRMALGDRVIQFLDKHLKQE